MDSRLRRRLVYSADTVGPWKELLRTDALVELSRKILIRLLPKIRKTRGCWEWTGTVNGNGYGIMHLWNGQEMVHRVAYFLFVGDLDPRLVIDHRCNNRKCVRPSHLRQVTTAENVLRGVGSSAKNARKKRCKWGHLFTPQNIYVPKGKPKGRHCKECQRRRNREYEKKRKALMDARRSLFTRS